MEKNRVSNFKIFNYWNRDNSLYKCYWSLCNCLWNNGIKLQYHPYKNRSFDFWRCNFKTKFSLWGATILPDGFTLKWFVALFTDLRFLVSLQRSFAIGIVSLLVSMFVIIPSIVISAYYFPKVLKVIEFISLLPFMVPAVVLAVGLLNVYSGVNVRVFGVPLIIIGAYFSVAFPFIYRGIKNSLDALHLKSLVETVNILGGTNFEAFRYVILPNLKKGIMSSGILSFAILLGEFMYANLLIGGSFETLQVYLYNMKGKSGHFTSAMVTLFFLFIFAVTFIAVNIEKISKSKVKRKD